MKYALLSALFLFSAQSFAIDKVITGDKAAKLMTAMFRTGIVLKESRDGIETEVVRNIICQGMREDRLSGGLLSSVKCLRDVDLSKGFGSKENGTLLQDSSFLEEALSEAGSDFDAAMGKWWVSASSIQCSIDTKVHADYKCTFTTEFN